MNPIILELENKLKEEKLSMPGFVKERAGTREYLPDSLICVAGERVERIQILVQGTLEIMNSFSDGKEFVFVSEESFTLLGDLEFFSRKMINASSVISKTKTAFVELDLETFTEWLKYERRFYDLIVYQMACKCYKGTMSQGIIKYKDSTYCVLRALLENSKETRDDMLVAECTHYELARMSGMSERTVNRVLRKLQKENVLSVGYRKILMNKKALHIYKILGNG